MLAKLVKSCAVVSLALIVAGCAALRDTRSPDRPAGRADLALDHFQPLPACDGNEVGLAERPIEFELLEYGLDNNEEGFRSANRRMARLVSDGYLRVRLVHEQTRQPYFVHVLTPKDFVTDFASIPIVSRTFFSSVGRHAESAVAHDWLYAFGYLKSDGGERFADRVFHQAIIDAGEWSPGRFSLWAPLSVWPSRTYRSPQERRFFDDGFIFTPGEAASGRLLQQTVRICPEPPGNVEDIIRYLVPTGEATPPPAR